MRLLCLLAIIGCNGGPLDSADLERGQAPAVQKQPASLKRLTDEHYKNTIASLFGEGIALPDKLDPVDQVDGLVAMGAALGTISPVGTERYESAAYQIAEQVMTDEALRSSALTCEPASVLDVSCARDSLATLGLQVWRRPLTEAQLDSVVGVFEIAATTLEDFDVGFQFALATLLMSPHFLYRVEVGEEDPGGDGLRYTDWEMASRLSYFLWNTMPDVALFAAAEAGDLTRKSTLALQVQRMLDDPRAHDGVRAFFSDQFDLDQLDEMTKDPLIFKHMSSELGPAAREETLTVIEDLLYVQNGDYRDLLTTQNTWVDRRLASIYDIAAPNMDGFGWVELPTESRRRGLLGQVGVLALNAHAVSTSVTQRGVFVRERLLCQSIPAPPADVDTSIPEVTAAAATMRERVAVHLQDPTCAVCHQITDPMGLGLENFDGIGRWRTRENEAVIDASGELDGVSFADGWELSQVVAEHQDLGPCLVESVFRYANGRGVGTGERDVVRWHSDGFLEMEHRVRFAMRDIALGPAFRLLGEASDEE